ncbi:hypothetical protein TL16_g04792 [Triparma laevis f. inornata]|uniref:Rhodanese domain-containing protein n=1 Tax=Triparma laevis f. inornata TaxID=1714386 RepID=A0A9W7AEG7_9STRA|nr:hypothetical protein TL16_g04792 [Triparma laevis f. inornata]
MFYKYTPLSTDVNEMASYRSLQLSLTSSLKLRGRLLLGQSLNEGLNGTFSGSYTALMCYAAAMGIDNTSPQSITSSTIVNYIQTHSKTPTSLNPTLLKSYAPAILTYLSTMNRTPRPIPPFTIPFSEFKWSLNVPNSSNLLSQVFPDLYIKVVKEIIGTGGLLESIKIEETGKGLLTPNEFHDQVSDMDDETILIDCRNDKEVQIGSFTSALNPKTKTYNQFPKWVDSNKSEGGEVVGRCRGCEKKWDVFTAKNVCTVCREQVLICDGCEEKGDEYWCEEHDDLKGIYYTNLGGRGGEELESMEGGLKEYLERIAIGKEFKSRRRTVMKQLDKLATYLNVAPASSCDPNSPPQFCRSCNDVKCDGKCWGYFGLNRKNKLLGVGELAEGPKKKAKMNYNDENSKKKGQVDLKAVKREEEIKFLKKNNLVAPVLTYSHDVSGTKVRIIPPYLNTVTCVVKPKNAGLNIVDYLTEFYVSCKDADDVKNSIANGGIKVNGRNVTAVYEVKFNDVIKREICVHEPLIKADDIEVEKRTLEGVGEVYCVNKPSSVPTHPAGQYLGNSLTCLVEGELGLDVKSLKPCHRLDKATSGLVLMSTEKSVVNKFNGLMTGEGKVAKAYIAMLSGTPEIKEGVTEVEGGWEVDINIELKDAKAGLRGVVEGGKGGKVCKTRFEILERREGGILKVACLPREGRGHQIRVHASWLGLPIEGDVLYGGEGIGGAGGGKEFRKGCLEIMNGMAGEKVEGCLVCKGGVGEESFKEDQLLGEGSEIRLHAWKYKFVIDGKEVELGVGEPVWG